MRYRILGESGLKVSTIGLGTWLTYGSAAAEDDAITGVRIAFDSGVNLFDTANEYQEGRAEEVLGKALAGLPRNDYLVCTKVYQPMGEGPLNRGLSRKHIFCQVDDSLRRLGTDYIDVYQCHRFDYEVPVEETAEAMNDLIRAGKVLYWGISEWNADQTAHIADLCRVRGWSRPVSNQLQYSLLWQRRDERLLPACAASGLGVLAWSPLAMGVLTGKYLPRSRPPDGSRGAGQDAHFIDRYLRPGVLEAVQEAGVLARQAGCTPGQLALAWCLRDQRVSGAIVGATRPEQLKESIAAADFETDEAALIQLDKIFNAVAPR